MLAAVDSRTPAYLAIDLRQNSGGDFTKPREQLIPRLKQRRYTGAKVFVITGRRTFSAAMVNAIDFRNLLGAVLVGEPPGEKPNSYQENDGMELPRSKMPDQLITPTWEAFRDRRDEPLEWIARQKR